MRPIHEFMQAAKIGHTLSTRAQHKMISVAKHNIRAKLTNLLAADPNSYVVDGSTKEASVLQAEKEERRALQRAGKVGRKKSERALGKEKEAKAAAKAAGGAAPAAAAKAGAAAPAAAKGAAPAAKGAAPGKAAAPAAKAAPAKK